MTQKEPTTLLVRCTAVFNRDSHYKGYDRNQVANKSTNARTDKTTGNFSMCHFYHKHYTLCHPGKQIETK